MLDFSHGLPGLPVGWGRLRETLPELPAGWGRGKGGKGGLDRRGEATR